MLNAKLIVVGGEAKCDEILLGLPAVIGRGKDCEITLRHPLVSRKHCEIYEANGLLRVRDLGSLNGTFVGKEQVNDEDLLPGELLTIGTVTFRAVYGDWSEQNQDSGSHASGHVLIDAENGTARDTTKASMDETELQKDNKPTPDGVVRPDAVG